LSERRDQSLLQGTVFVARQEHADAPHPLALLRSRCDHELPENYLALCPVCAAKFKHARKNDETEMLAALRDSGNAELSVVLAGQEAGINFVGVHRSDLLAALGAVDKKHKRLA
jgi:hypothetical protein